MAIVAILPNNPPPLLTNTINNLRGITTHKLLMFAEGDRLEKFQAGFDMNTGVKWYYDAIQKMAQNGLICITIASHYQYRIYLCTGSQR